MGEYPTEKQLSEIASWDNGARGATALIEYLRSVWYIPKWGLKVSGKRVVRLELHTGGWSGNEQIIGALRKSWFWLFFWQKSERGGHHYFTVPAGQVGADRKRVGNERTG